MTDAYLVSRNEIDRDILTRLATENANRNICVEFCKTRNTGLCTRLPDIAFAQEELHMRSAVIYAITNVAHLCAEILNGDWLWVVHCY
jgi:hypothetical protein